MEDQPQNSMKHYLIWPLVVTVFGGLFVLCVEYSWFAGAKEQPVPTPVTNSLAPAHPRPLTPIIQVTTVSPVREPVKPTVAPIPPRPRRDYSIMIGTWRVVEKVTDDTGGWVIVWSYSAQFIGEQFVLSGHKTRVNDATPTSGESQARSTLRIAITDLQGDGSFEEHNHRGEILRGSIHIVLGPDLKSFSGEAFVGGKKTSDYTGMLQ